MSTAATSQEAADGATDSPAATGKREALVTRWVRNVAGLWRRSLQFRVVTSTLLLGLVVVSIICLTMYRSIADGLVQDRIEQSQKEALRLATTAESQFVGSPETSNPNQLGGFAEKVMTTQLAPPEGADSRYVLLVPSQDNDSRPRPFSAISSNDVALGQVPSALRTQLGQEPERQQTMTIEFERPVDGTTEDDGPSENMETVPTVLIGSQIEIPSAGNYDLYFFYPMDEEQATLSTISNSLLLGAAFLILLVSGIAYIVTSTVVTPVRRAASAAERLAAGHLNERMSARGRDDLALLGQSFNDMADNLQTQIRQLEGLSRVQQRFVSDVSHELRTPLTTIRMAADMLHASRDELEAVPRRSAELLHDELDRFEELLADLLEISRYDAGATVLDRDPVDLVTVTGRVVESSRSIADAHACEVTVHSPEEGAVEAEADARRIERILRNLVVNAIEHGEGEPVDVWIGADDDAVAVVVQDHGVGLKAGEASLVFNRFWRSDPARTRTTGGSGLGLAIALEDARLHNGWLQAWGEPGAGSRFRLTVPRRAAETLTVSPLPLTPREGDLGGGP